jgi:hypothetical protein
MKPISHFYLVPKLECGELFICAIHTPSRGGAGHKDDFMLIVLMIVSHIFTGENV